MENKKWLIDANYLRKYQFSSIDSIYDEGWNDAIEFIMKKAPTVDAVEVAHGRWLTWGEKFPKTVLIGVESLGVFCSVCEKHADNKTNYCPNCGAKMDGEKNNEK